MSKRGLFTGLAGALLVALLAAGMHFQTGNAQTATPAAPAQTGDERRTVTVTGSGEALTEPEQAYVYLGVQTDADTASEAYSTNNEQMTQVIDALVAAGIAEADIQTQFMSLYPRYDNQPQPNGAQPEIAGYTASSSVQVLARDLEQIGDVIDAAVDAGANTIGGIRFDVNGDTDLLGQARSDAMDDARAKAEQLASLAGAELGQVISISEAEGGIGIPFADVAVGGAGGAISPGAETLRVNIVVTWQLQD